MSECMIFGLTMLVVGMGGTLITLAVIALVIRVLTAIFPAERKENKTAEVEQ